MTDANLTVTVLDMDSSLVESNLRRDAFHRKVTTDLAKIKREAGLIADACGEIADHLESTMKLLGGLAATLESDEMEDDVREETGRAIVAALRTKLSGIDASTAPIFDYVHTIEDTAKESL